MASGLVSAIPMLPLSASMRIASELLATKIISSELLVVRSFKKFVCASRVDVALSSYKRHPWFAPNSASPSTSRVCPGLVVPIPTLPDIILITSLSSADDTTPLLLS